jgi:hypothetical protein
LFTYGTSSDLWGAPLTPSDINNNNFGVVFTAQIKNTVARIEYIDVQVYYTTSSGTKYVSISSGSGNPIVVDENGNLGVGLTDTAGYGLNVNGKIKASSGTLIYKLADGCGVGLTLGSTCSTIKCDATNYYQCSVAGCGAGTPQSTCTLSPVGRLIDN